jgi:hypothetical protein
MYKVYYVIAVVAAAALVCAWVIGPKFLWCQLFHGRYGVDEEWTGFSEVMRTCKKCGCFRN